MLKVELTTQEAQALTELINIAVKAGGLPVAQAAVFLANKLQAALEAANTETAAEEAQEG